MEKGWHLAEVSESLFQYLEIVINLDYQTVIIGRVRTSNFMPIPFHSRYLPTVLNFYLCDILSSLSIFFLLKSIHSFYL